MNGSWRAKSRRRGGEGVRSDLPRRSIPATLQPIPTRSPLSTVLPTVRDHQRKSYLRGYSQRLSPPGKLTFHLGRQLGVLRAANIVDARREGTWVYYSISEQSHALVESQLETLTKAFGAERALKADHARLVKSCGPNVCK